MSSPATALSGGPLAKRTSSPCSARSRIPEYGLRALEDGGLSLPQAATVIYTAVHYTFGHVIGAQDSAEAQLTEEFELAYPTVARVMNEGRRVGLTATDVFDAGLSLIIGKL
ncbi:TetR/AcrR family transcriptional regulator C-terminal domain-containing protein [Streptomyces sp. NPDC048357]|uniref:TetR/AcrR family transcriptional regulator C-terminal domain-containing protein n=1 Tax=Streptomyces sp. NPDC048357 TaxID=3154719 RepID=UPI0034152DC2